MMSGCTTFSSSQIVDVLQASAFVGALGRLTIIQLS